jgi:lipopolysaccharide transport system ATP-binding protein
VGEIAIRVEGLGKRYRIGTGGAAYRTLRETMSGAPREMMCGLRRDARDLAQKAEASQTGSEFFWALKHVSFEVEAGEIVGIVGSNGAGKTTLLKVLSRITEPTAGRAEIHGRVGSLLEVGTGFHPELTGRENIYLNGAILGMKRKEIARRFDEIVTFAETERFIDTPVKRYSSGMYLRLAFSVAAHLEPEILFVDEVLAVGDAAFQRKCLGKMGDVARTGSTVLLVSHNLTAIRQLCGRALWLDDGEVRVDAVAHDAITAYLKNVQTSDTTIDLTAFVNPYGQGELAVLSISLVDPRYASFAVAWDEPIRLLVRLRARQDLAHVGVGIGCATSEGMPVFTVRSTDKDPEGIAMRAGEERAVECTIRHNLRAGLYVILIGVFYGSYVYYYNPSAAQMEVSEMGSGVYLSENSGLINCNASWSV